MNARTTKMRRGNMEITYGASGAPLKRDMKWILAQKHNLYSAPHNLHRTAARKSFFNINCFIEHLHLLCFCRHVSHLCKTSFLQTVNNAGVTHRNNTDSEKRSCYRLIKPERARLMIRLWTQCDHWRWMCQHMDLQRQLPSWERRASGSTVNREWMVQYTRHIQSTTILTAKHFKVKGQTSMEKSRSSPQEEASNIKRHLRQQKPLCCCMWAAKENILTCVGWILMWSVAKMKRSTGSHVQFVRHLHMAGLSGLSGLKKKATADDPSLQTQGLRCFSSNLPT